MYVSRNLLSLGLALTALSLPAAGAGKNRSSAEATNPEIATRDDSVLWRRPVDISSRNLFYGPGGEEHQPRGVFTFLKEDLEGTNPKIIVRDQSGVKWTVKLGAEARPETAATRLVWAVGYFANEDYFLPNLKVQNMPPRLKRGQNLIALDGSLPNVRLKRHLEHEKKRGHWSWRENQFAGTRELNGLRVLMALINNWDLTDENTAIYERTDHPDSERIYMVSDLGSTFGTGNLTWPLGRARGNLQTYSHSKFITRTTPDYVDLHTPVRPALYFLATPHEYFRKLQLCWIGKRVPRTDARWMGDLLALLTPDQIRDAFRAAGYSPQQVEGFATAVQARIAELQEL
jgi:hypothetical protein